MKIGIDIHGVLDTYRALFLSRMSRWAERGHEVHIMTGSPGDEALAELKNLRAAHGVNYTHFYSIVDYNLYIKNPTMHLEENGWWMSDESWNRSKGDYASRVGLDIMFESDGYYAPYFPHNCTFVLVPPEGFEKVLDLL